MDWGMRNRMNRIIKPETGRTVMLAVDHGYFQGPTTKLENPRKTITPLLPYADALMITRGVLRTSVPPEWDGPVVRQSTRSEAYADVVGQLLRNGLAYPCNCSRKDIATAGLAGIEGPVYPGTCRTAGAKLKRQRAVRLLTHDEPIAFADRVFGHQVQQVESSVGDFVLKRADGLFAYQLAVVVDDAWQGITHVVRGADLLASTPRQIHLQRILGFARPSYAHVPLALDAAGRKLSKTDAAHPLDARKPREALVQALVFLGQSIPETGRMSDFWAEAAVRWNAEAVPRHPG